MSAHMLAPHFQGISLHPSRVSERGRMQHRTLGDLQQHQLGWGVVVINSAPCALMIVVSVPYRLNLAEFSGHLLILCGLDETTG